MIEEPTVFILGAGASVPYGYPTGAGLREQIINNVFGIHTLNTSLGGQTNLPKPFCRCYTKDELIEEGYIFTEKFFNSGRPIDEFLNNNPKYSYIGKLSIICNILDAESDSNFDEKMDPTYKNQNWYSYLFEKMITGLTGENGFEEFGNNQVSFITFNYDRSLEYYLYRSLSNSYSQATEKPDNLKRLIDELRKIPIKHVYGRVCDLHWQSDKEGYDYKYKLRFGQLLELIDNIGIINERAKTEETEEMKKVISDAKRIFFLGFRYLPENMDILDLYKIIKPEQQVYGTVIGLSGTEIQYIQHQFKKNNPRYKDITIDTLRNAIKLQQKNCYDLLKDHLIKI